MTKLYRIEAYILNLNGDCDSKEHVIRNITNNRHPQFIKIRDIKETDVGEWDDNHELNQIGADYTKYFPDMHPGSNDELLKKAYLDIRNKHLQSLEQIDNLKSVNELLERENAKLNKVQEFLKTIKDLTI